MSSLTDMLASPTKKEELELLELMLSGLEIAVRTHHIDEAKDIGQSIKKWKHRLATKDYSRLDAFQRHWSSVRFSIENGTQIPDPWVGTRPIPPSLT